MTVLVDHRERLDAAAVERRVAGLADLLQHRGVGTSRRALIALRNRAAWPIALYAIDRVGAEAVVAPWRSTPDELQYLVDDASVVAVLCEATAPARDHPLAIAVDDRLEAHIDSGGTRHGSVVGARPRVRVYTSGTTGRPKAVVPVTGDDVIHFDDEDARMLRHWGLAGRAEVHLTTAPLHHVSGWGYVNLAMGLGHRVVLMDGFDAAALLRTIEREQVTYLWLAPVHFSRIAALPAAARAVDLSSVKAVLHGAAPCPVELKRSMLDLFGPVLWEMYGGTEGMATMASTDEWLAHPGTVGRSVPELGFEASVRGDDGTVAPPGTHGLVYCRSAGRRFEYDGAPEATASTWLDDGWFTLGDVGYMDDDGFLYLVDRVKDLVITGGANVYPAEVERVLTTHPLVADAAAIGVPDADLGERVHAVVVALDPGRPPDAADLDAHCRTLLVGYKCPRSFELVEQLPRDPVGKLRRRQLRDERSPCP